MKAKKIITIIHSGEMVQIGRHQFMISHFKFCLKASDKSAHRKGTVWTLESVVVGEFTK